MFARGIGPAALVSLLAGCSAWVPVRNAHDIPPKHALKIDAAGRSVVVSHLTTCDRAGFIVARATADCSCGDVACRYDLRRQRVSVHEMNFDYGAAVLAGILVAFAGLPFVVWASEASR